MVIVTGLTLPCFLDGPTLIGCQEADEAELVPEWVLHDRPVEAGGSPT